MAWIPRRPWAWRLRSQLGRLHEIMDGEPDGYVAYVDGMFYGAQPSHDTITLLIHAHQKRGRSKVEVKPFWHKRLASWLPRPMVRLLAENKALKRDAERERLARRLIDEALRQTIAKREADLEAVLTVVNLLLEDVAEKPERLVRAQEIARRDLAPLIQ